MKHNEQMLSGQKTDPPKTWFVNGKSGNSNVFDIVWNLERLQNEHVDIKIQ